MCVCEWMNDIEERSVYLLCEECTILICLDWQATSYGLPWRVAYKTYNHDQTLIHKPKISIYKLLDYRQGRIYSGLAYLIQADPAEVLSNGSSARLMLSILIWCR